MHTLEQVKEAFQLLDEWEDRYHYLAELGEKLPPLPDKWKTPDHQVHECMSNVWIVAEPDPDAAGRVQLRADSDTPIIKGVVAVLVAVYSGRLATEIRTVDADAVFRELGIYEHLSPNRHVGVYAMLRKIEALAHSAANMAAYRPETCRTQNQKTLQ